MRDVHLHHIYRHFKGNFYYAQDIAIHTETETPLVVYRKLYDDGSLWARPLDMFLSEVDHEKYPQVTQQYRFEEFEEDAFLFESFTEIAKRIGFEFYGTTTTDTLVVRPEVRDMCAADKCHNYNKCWTCPPGCGSIEDYQQEINRRQHVLLVQTMGELEDSFDIEGIMETSDTHAERFRSFVEEVHAFWNRIKPIIDTSNQLNTPFFFGAGGCNICKTCAYPDNPCRFPEKSVVSMEAAGLVVNEVCTASGVAYNHGPNTIAFSSCVVF